VSRSPPRDGGGGPRGGYGGGGGYGEGGGGGGGWRPQGDLGPSSYAEERRAQRAKIEVDASDIWGRSPTPSPERDEPAAPEKEEEPEPAEPEAAEPAAAAAAAPDDGASAALDDDVAEALENGSDSEEAGEQEAAPAKRKRKKEKKKKRKSKKSKKKKKKKRRRRSTSSEESESEESVDYSLAAHLAPTPAAEGPDPGPTQLPEMDAVNYGKALRPGEGDAIAAYVQSGKRIPRRGEVGLDADQISGFEDLGYVMSGSRHKRMNAIRIRKENQVLNAEEKKAMGQFSYEEKVGREADLMNQFKTIIQSKGLGAEK